MLMACALLLQSLWVPFHLAHESHHVPGAAPTRTTTEAVAAVAAADDAKHHEPHSSLDHRITQKQRDDHEPVDLLYWPLLAPLRLPLAGVVGAAPRAPPAPAAADPGSSPPPSRAPPAGPFVRRC